MDENNSFAEALRKAREIAAKMQVNLVPKSANSTDTQEPDGQDNKKQLALQIANNLSRSRIPKEIRVISQGMTQDGDLIIHMMIPSIIVCLFAGKNNETINWMEDRSGAKMELNSDHPYASVNEKPLTIIGEPDKVEHAREIVNQYIKEKDELLGINANNMQLSLGIEYSELLIPKEAVGLVIGKQGENIKKVNNDTGCVVKFKPPLPTDDDRYRTCTFQGTPTQIKKAREQISDLVEYLKQKFGLARPVPQPGQIFEQVRVSALKAGIVIGKGGENIKQINSLSGATVCIDRSVPDNAEYRTFFVVGSHDQVEHAKFLIREKSGEIAELPEDVVKALNPMTNMELFANQPACPAFLPAVQPYLYGQMPMYPQESYYPHVAYPTDGYAAESQAQNDSNQPQDYSAAWAAYYQQCASLQNTDPNQPPTADAEGWDQAAYAAYWQAYYSQYYSQGADYSQNQPSQQPPNEVSHDHTNSPHPQIHKDNVFQSEETKNVAPVIYEYNNKPLKIDEPEHDISKDQPTETIRLEEEDNDELPIEKKSITTKKTVVKKRSRKTKK